ncbi:LOW QUALITY PROTEIN: lysosomal acid glucosylceramidase [Drosophila sulfurigaster albostrigata]|uniref:LOW QUALITY PROTEIN: lysosomal acid glucosylceramidase n=1 Tax=Drosophila sulfurigaster albostrigata TaxID=89887 RepID=UPI002D21B40D|nr:LOW QUALITY PROTEIN: lysosomal acid glucosylceramidase [Drosophila sulfurigaster albostrigata]
MKVFSLCLYLVYALWASHDAVAALSTDCELRETKHGSVCVCNSSHCDYLEQPALNDSNQLVVISSSKNGLRYKRTDGSFFAAKHIEVQDRQFIDENFVADAIVVEDNRAWLQFSKIPQQFVLNARIKTVQLTVKREQRYQKITNFGGAFTGSVSHILQQLPTELQDHVYRSYFHEEGIAYNSIRMSIGGSDFDLQPWAYNEQPRNDPDLSNFTTLDPRDLQKIEQLERLKSVAELKELQIMAAAWSAPTWMKSNERWTGFGQLKPEYYQAWAQYHLRFLELMQSKNMPVWAISTGNEPLNGVIGFFFVHFMSMGWTPWQQAIWLSDHLGPTIRNSSQRHVLIFGNDDQRYTYPSWFRKMRASRSNALDYLDGLAVHWYWDEIFGPQLIDEAHAEMPNKLMLNTESCIGDKPWQTHGPELGSWGRGESYMRAYMQDLQHNINGWLDWNLVLDEKGGPNYIHNYVDSPVIVNTTNRAEFYKQPIYYAIGHFSKFVPAQSVRIETQTNETDAFPQLNVVGFQRPDNSIALILYNGENLPVDVALDDSQRGKFKLRLPARSWHTVIYK